MMARGYSRNTATALAAQVSRYGSYAAMFQQLTFVPTLMQALLGTARRMYNALADICDTIMAARFSAFVERMRRLANG